MHMCVHIPNHILQMSEDMEDPVHIPDIVPYTLYISLPVINLV